MRTSYFGLGYWLIGPRGQRAGRTTRHEHSLLVALVLCSTLLALSAAPAFAACRTAGNNIFCDTCADAQSDPLATRSVLLSPTVTPGGGTQGSNNSFCDIASLAPGDQLTMTVEDVASANISSFEVDFTRVGANPASLTPSSLLNQSVIVPGGSISPSFSHSEAGPAATRVNANIADTQPTGQQPSVSAKVTCSCTPAKGTLQINKLSIGGTGTFPITATPANGGAINYSVTTTGSPNGTGSQSQQVAPGSYTIAETPPAGWVLDSIQCGTAGSTAVVVANQTTVCTVTNRKKAAVTIKKETIGGFGAFQFSATTVPVGQSAIAGFTETTSAGTNPSTGKALTDLVPGTYTFTETPPAGQGWALTNMSCTGTGITTTSFAGLTGTFTLEPGASGTCTFTNSRQTGGIKVLKKTIGGDDKFDFVVKDSQGQTVGTADDLMNGQMKTFSPLPTGNYTIEEINIPAGWTLTGASCGQLSGNSVSVTVTTDQTIECEFTNELDDERASLTIIKDVTGNGDPTSFSFTNTGPGGGFSLSDGQSRVFTTAGQYVITETQLAGYTLTGLVCTGTGANGVGDAISVASRQLTVNLDNGENITCTFTNTRQTGSLKVKKVTIGGDGTFNFTATGQPGFNLKNGETQSFSGLAPGQYTVKEVNLPAGWKLQSVSCTGSGNKQGNGITVDIAGNDAVTCTFTNFKEKDERMKEVTEVFINRRVDNLLTHGPDRARMLRRLQPGEPPTSLKDGSIKDVPPLKLGQSAQQSLGATSFADPFARRSEGLFAREEDDEQPWNRESASTSPLLSSISSQLSGLGAGSSGGASSFKFGTSLSDIREAAIAAEAERQKSNLAAAGLSFAGQPFVNPYSTMRPGFDLWIEGHVSRYSDGTGGIGRDGTFKLLYVGADYAIAPGILIGALVQIDDTREELDDVALAGEVEGTGWMAGPYVGIRLLDNLFLDARAAWGTSSNDIWLNDATSGRRSGSFDTDRWLASANLTGNYNYGPWRLSPQLGVAYGSEAYDTYFNSLGQAVDGSRASIGRLTGGAEVGYRMMLDSGAILEPHVSLTGIWNFDTDDVSIGGVLVQSDETRARVEGGLIYRAPTGFAMRGAIAYDGIGGDDFEAVSGQLWVSVPLN